MAAIDLSSMSLEELKKLDKDISNELLPIFWTGSGVN